jgi:putative tryptophan/tyrosine transport system substrate-binding protein
MCRQFVRARRPIILVLVKQKRIADLALRARLPAMFGSREFADSGGLVTCGASLQRTYRRAAVYIDKILHGVDPGSIPIEEPTRFDLVIDQKTARLLGLTVPPSLLVQADDLIE